MQPIHDRMPVILPTEYWEIWLDTANTDKQALQTLLTQYPHDEMTAYKVSAQVNSTKHNDEECIKPIERTL